MSAQHTPGPWRLSDGNASSFVYALDETGGVNRFSCLVQGGYSYCGRTHKDRTLESEIAANARLIAAAPELLDALEDAEYALVSVLTLPTLQQQKDAAKQAIKFARVAIDKARGEA